ncbi:MAG: HD domain-containing protein [Ardenticatenaceae bacterium]|nr:HD domain-containing protein [Ardenticatenaceae bacterium]
MTSINWTDWEPRFLAFLQEQAAADAAHDQAHVARVVHNARQIATLEGADQAVVIPAAWLHDCVIVLKDSPLRAQASRLAAETAVVFLRRAHYPSQYLEAIAHAIEAHSFSAGIPPQTIEAKVVQDADRLDALGAVGMARTFMVGGALQRPLYYPDDPFCAHRPPDDAVATLDHFYTKLLKLAGTMQTAVGRQEAERRTAFMHSFLTQLAGEIGASLTP